MPITVGAVVLARLRSSRLPGKVLREFGGKPLLAHVLGRVGLSAELDRVIVATSAEADDDPIAEWCAEHRLSVHRGPHQDVLDRVLGAAAEARLDAVARVNADSPWVDPALLDRAIRIFRRERPDLVTNLLERDWPYGISAEIISVDALRRIAADATAQDREHVSARIYSQPEGFDILDIPAEQPGGAELRLTVDSEEDARRFSTLLGALGERAGQASTAEVIAAAEAQRVAEGERIS